MIINKFSILTGSELKMSIPEFLMLTRGEITEKEIRKMRSMENKLVKLCKNKQIRNFVIMFLAIIILSSKIAFATGTDKIDTVGLLLLNIVRTFGYWVCTVMCIVKVIKALVSGAMEDITGIVVKHVIGFASFYALPWLFDLIKDVFS